MDQNLGLIWERCLKFMRDNLSASEHEDVKKLEHSFDLLFDRVQPVSLINHNLTLLVPSDFYKEYIEENYLSLLSAALKKNIGKGVKLWYSVMENKPQGLEKPATQNYKGISVQAPKVQEVLPTTVSKSLVNPFVVPGIKKVNIDANLNPNLSFDNFVEGESNKFACTVAKTIAKRPGATSFNPLFIHGGVGVGKTHLAHAIGLDIKQNLPFGKNYQNLFYSELLPQKQTAG
jgi:chromosomal replication initiator protein